MRKDPFNWIFFFILPFILLHHSSLDGQTPGSLFWSSSVGWYVHSVTPTGDINSDGFGDLFVGSGDDIVYCFSGGGLTAGDILWSWRITADVWSVVSIDDTNGDGIDDCIAGTGCDTIYCFSGRPVAGLSEILWSYPTSGDIWIVDTISDVNGDGIDDVLAGTGDDRVICLDGAWGHVLWTYTANSDILTLTMISDIDGDGLEDCVAGGKDDRVLCISGGSVGTGTLLWEYSTGSTVRSVDGIADVDMDGISDVLAGSEDDYVYCISGNSSGPATLLWRFQTGATVFSVSSIDDVNGDGRSDCLAGSQDNVIYCLSGYDGSSIWTYTTGSTVLRVDTLSDINGTGRNECIAGGQDNTVYCIEGGSSGTGQLLWSALITGSVKDLTSIPDVTGNGVPDVVGGSDDSFVYVFEGGESGSHAETISPPDTPSSPSIGMVGQTLSFSTSGSSSNLGHSVEYRFDWGDGTYSTWGSASLGHFYTAVGVYSVKAQARCATHTDIVSSWSSGKSVSISGHILSVTVHGSGSVSRSPEKTEYNHGENVALTAQPSAGYTFDHWSGDLSGNTNPVVIIMDGNQSVSAYFVQVPETVSTPSIPSGPSSGIVGQSLSFSTGGSSSNLGHSVEYRFDWGDGTFSTWGSASVNHVYTTAGLFSVKAQARCASHTEVLSGWSSGKSVSVSGYILSISVQGSGSVSKSPEKTSYNPNENVTLTAQPSTGYTFDHWFGDLSGNVNPVVIVMNGNKSVSAYFVQTQETITKPLTPSGPSNGTVNQSLSFSTGGSSSNLGHSVEYRFDWGDGTYSTWGSATGNHVYTTAGVFSVKAQARCALHTGVLSGWSSSKNVSVSGYTLNVTIQGSGSVSRSPDKMEYNHNENVTITAQPATGYTFDYWAGDLSGSTNPAVIVMNGNKSMSAYFVQTQETITKPLMPSGPSNGTVNQSLSFSTGGSSSNLGHSVEYRFDWGDGTFSSWGSATGNHVYTTAGVFSVKAQARCASHTGVLSGWSSSKNVSVSGYTLLVMVQGLGSVSKSPDKPSYNPGENVTLTAHPSTGYTFDYWTGDLSGNTNPAVISMGGNRNVTAYFSTTIPETVTTPMTPTGPSEGGIGDPLTYYTSGSTNTAGHPVEYRFGWGDGTYSPWGSNSYTHQWFSHGSYEVRSQARCAIHTSITSSWSQAKLVLIGSTGIQPDFVEEIPRDFDLLPNYPNPFNATTSIVFHLPDPSHVHLCIYNLSGEVINSMVDEVLCAGVYQVSWDAKDRRGTSVPSGLYICRMVTTSFQSVQMLLYMK